MSEEYNETKLTEFTESNTSATASGEESADRGKDGNQSPHNDVQQARAESPGDEQDVLCPDFTPQVRSRAEELVEDGICAEKLECAHAVEYLYEDTGATLAKSSAKRYDSAFRLYIEYLHDKELRVREADISDVSSFLKYRARQNRRKSTLSGDRSAISSLYRHMEIHQDVEPEVSCLAIRERIDLEKFQTPSNIDRGPLEKWEVKELFKALDDTRNRLMALVAVECGPRAKAITVIKIDDVDFEEQKITLQDHKSDEEYEVPISDELSVRLRRWIEIHRPSIPTKEGNDYLFPNRLREGDIDSGYLSRKIKNAAEEAGIQEELGTVPISDKQKEIMNTDKDERIFYKVTLHALRHTFNKLLEEAGVPRDARSDAMNHSSTEVTEEFYDEDEGNYTELIESLFDGVGLSN